MKTALITSTIHVPEVLRLYRACSPLPADFTPGWDKETVGFFVALEEKCDPAITQFLVGIPNCSVHWGGSERWACSDLIGWNTVERRNIATLEALKWGADVIVTVDDDNIPMSNDYFDRFEKTLGQSFSGMSVEGRFQTSDRGKIARWFDPGRLLVPYARHRGYPPQFDGRADVRFAVGAKVGVAAGAVMGDPDISAVDRMAHERYVHYTSELLRVGLVVDSNTRTVFNTQNTAFLRELAPCFLLCPQFGRFADIFASLVCQRVMRETGHVVHFGQPFVWQQRNPHNLLDDLKAEMWGMEHVVEFAEWLNEEFLAFSTGTPPLAMVRHIYEWMNRLPWMPTGVSELGAAWCDDVEKVLA